MESKKISVVICTFNRGEYLMQTLESLLVQTLLSPDFEVCVVDNASTDSTAELVASFAQAHLSFPLRYFLEKKQGISHARNRGVEESCGELIAFIDDDETVKPDYLSILTNFFDRTPDAMLVGGPVEPVYESEKPEWLSPFLMRLLTGYYNKGSKIILLEGKDYPGTGHATLRKSLFQRYGHFNPSLGRAGTSLMGAEDKDFFLRIIEGGDRCYYHPSAVIYHHIPAYKLTDDFFQRLTLAMGKSERVRTLGISRSAFYKRCFDEAVKWCATFVLYLYYFLKITPCKGNYLIRFRFNVTKGLLRRA